MAMEKEDVEVWVLRYSHGKTYLIIPYCAVTYLESTIHSRPSPLCLFSLFVFRHSRQEKPHLATAPSTTNTKLDCTILHPPATFLVASFFLIDPTPSILHNLPSQACLSPRLVGPHCPPSYCSPAQRSEAKHSSASATVADNPRITRGWHLALETVDPTSSTAS